MLRDRFSGGKTHDCFGRLGRIVGERESNFTIGLICASAIQAWNNVPNSSNPRSITRIRSADRGSGIGTRI